MEEPFELLPRKNVSLSGGYGARAIALSRDKKTLFVGCKDGSITAIDLERAIRGADGVEQRLRTQQAAGQPRAGVRAIYDCGGGWLLVGDDLRSLDLVPWRRPPAETEFLLRAFETPGAPEEFSPITMIEDWDSEAAIPEVVVSLRQGDTWVYRVDGSSAKEGADLHLVQIHHFKDVRAVCGVLRAGPARLLISESGPLWLVVGSQEPVELGTDALEDPWDRFERPGLISDVSTFSMLSGPPLHAGAFLSTDEGVFRLDLYWDEENERSVVRIDKELLPGLSGMSMSVSPATWRDRNFLWVSDLIGDVSLFWSPSYRPNEAPPPWRRLGFRLESSQVIRSVATTLVIEDADVLVIGQACRSDRIVVTWYADEPPLWEPRGEPFRVAQLLSRGTWSMLNQRAKQAGASRGEWAPEAVLADFFEEAGEYPGELASFLANPHTDLAWSVLERVAETSQTEGRTGEAVLMWTYALVGTIHRRMKDRREQQCLGVIRWLRRLSERCARSGVVWHKEVGGAIERAIQHARKWGVFGNTYYTRQEIEVPLEALRDARSDYRKFDHIVYCSLLFGRHMNLEAEFPKEPRGPQTPWDVRYLCLPCATVLRELVAVSWRSGTELYERLLSGRDSQTAWRQLWPKPREGDNYGVAANGDEAYSRKLILGQASSAGSRSLYLLEAPTKARGIESLRLWWIDPQPEGDLEAAAEASLEDGETVYSMIELSPGLVLAGTQFEKGDKEQLPLVVARVTLDRRLQLLRGSGEPLPVVYPETKTIEGERVPALALALDRNEPSPANRFTVIVGGGDGQILRISIRILEDTFILEKWTKVGRLGSPIRTLAYQAKRLDGLGERGARVFAGAADGTIVAFQEVGAVTLREDGQGDEETAFATLWATREEGPIARFHLCKSRPSPEDGELDLALAVSQKGMAALFLNTSQVNVLKKGWDQHQRLKVPGERLGRFSLGTTVFGSDLMDTAGCDGNGGESDEGRNNSALEAPGRHQDGGVARLVVATGEGTLRQLTLHYPKYTESRKAMFHYIQGAWLSTLLDSQGRVRVSLLRKIESMHASAPHLPSVYVRSILSAKPERRPWYDRIKAISVIQGDGPARQWIPRHLHALADLDEEWSAGRSLKGRLRAALLAAREVGDIMLFKEILEVTLRRANEELFQQAMSVGDWRFADQFRELMRDLDEMKGVWLGASGDLDTKIRIVFAKNLVDGDTLWSLAAVLDDAGSPLREAMKTRVELIHRFLAAGDPLLALETLRVANLAVLRACRRLADPRSHLQELHWGAIRGYFEAVGGFAALVAHSGRGDMSESEAVAHEICRAYALGILVCPSHAFRLSSWMCEADLPPEFGMRVRVQLQLLQMLLGKAVHHKPKALFDAVARKLQLSEGESGILLTSEQRNWVQETEIADLGQDNRELLQEWAPFDGLLQWLRTLADRLGSEAANFGVEEVRRHYERLRSGVKESGELAHSRAFWISALESLIEALGADLQGMNQAPQMRARPDFVLFTRSLGRWCTKQRENLRERRRRYMIFDPQYSMYLRTLEILGTAAAGFPRGAALQKDMVLGVLGHSLLELLDEHLLELWECAQVLDPKQTWDREDLGEDLSSPVAPRSRAAEFASYLLSTARRAELIPKNLRNLQGLLTYPVTEVRFAGTRTLRQLFGEFAWHGEEDVPSLTLEARSYHFLRLTLWELEQNHVLHGLSRETPRVAALLGKECGVRMEFPYDPSDLGRLVEVREESENLQRPVRPKEEEHSKSHGVGLYLANLAASTEGWRLRIDDLDNTPGRLPFTLVRVNL